MSLKFTVARLLRQVLVRRISFAEDFVGELATTRPDIVARRAAVMGDKVLQALSSDQQLAVLRSVWQERPMDVIKTVNAHTGKGFRYVGNGMTKVILGAGSQQAEGWLSTDIEHLDLVAAPAWHRMFLPSSVDRMLAEHVFEHLSLPELQQALRHVHSYLKPGGRLRLAVPDAFHPSRYYYNLVKPGGWETPLEHKLFLDHEMLTRIGTDTGLQVHLLEYFDGVGVFHAVDFDESDGAIRRCARNNIGLDTANPEIMSRFHASIPEHLRQQFIDRGMSYTSLIADLVKPENA